MTVNLHPNLFPWLAAFRKKSKQAVWNLLRPKAIFSEFDLESLSILLENGFSFSEALDLLEEEKNHACFQAVRNCLGRGMDAAAFFPAFCPPAWRGFLDGFLKTQDFASSLTLSRRILSSRRRMHVLFQKNLAYPLLMLAVSLAGILVFNTFCFPAMLSMMEGFAPADSSLTAMAALLRISSYSMLALLAAAAFLGICLLPSKNRVKAYERLCRTPLGSLWVQYESLNFARFLTESLRAGLATQQAMTMFSSLSFHPLAADLARKTEKALQEGESLDAAMQGPEFDPLLPRFLRLAAYVEEPADLLESYLEMGTKRLEARIHRLLKVLEGISYACIGYMVILVYQVLMLPLNLLGSF